MPRKPLTAKQLQKKWNDRLKRAGLSMDAGTTRRITYIGGTAMLDALNGDPDEASIDRSLFKDVTYNPDKK